MSEVFYILSIASGGDVQNELEGLGVNVFDQGTFEEGVMKQLDEEVARHTVKQRQRFLVEEYSRVKQERKLVLLLQMHTLSLHILLLSFFAVLFNESWNRCPKKLQPFSLVLSVMLCSHLEK